MFELDKQTLRTPPSLLPLRMALIAAESETPARPTCPAPSLSTDELLALTLIERMKTEYQKPLPCKDSFPLIDFGLQEVIPCHA